MAKIIMIQGTMSNVGKSIITAGLCRIFKEDGYRVAPFKSQNMALNSYVTHDGLEMGRAQVVQAEACGIPPDVRMNPILLKPTNDTGSQVILNGCVLGHMKATDYFNNKLQFKAPVLEAFHSLCKDFDIIVIEGAGSPAEINLNHQDIVNMGLAEWVNAPVLLVGDIDRGGVFASLFGTIALLKPEEQERIQGIIINKFRGDLSLLQTGIDQFQGLVSPPILGVVPHLSINIEDEDSLSPQLLQKVHSNLLDIAVIHLPKISNFTDFTALSCDDSVGLRYVSSHQELNEPDCIILPGSKNTISDLLWLRQNGLEVAIKKAVEKGVPLIGICGGFQMLGEELSDPFHTEEGGTACGLGFFSQKTTFSQDKTRTQVEGTVSELDGFFAPLSGSTFSGYEIHMGKTTDSTSSFSLLNRDKTDGCVKDNVLGTYVHGIFDDGTFTRQFTNLLLQKKGLSPQDANTFSYKEYKESQFNQLADTLRQSLDLDKIYAILDKYHSL